MAKADELKEKYKAAKAAKVGDKVECPSCKTLFEKTNYQQAFCKSKEGTQCKDFYWNNVIATKRNNTTRISPASAAYSALKSLRRESGDKPVIISSYKQSELDRQDRLYNELNSEGGEVLVARCEWCECINCRCDD